LDRNLTPLWHPVSKIVEMRNTTLADKDPRGLAKIS
jgi:hypothetical protein